MRVKVVVDVATSSGVARVKLVGLGGLGARGGEGDGGKRHAYGLCDGSHDDGEMPDQVTLGGREGMQRTIVFSRRVMMLC